MISEVVVQNPLVEHIWRLMPEKSIYRNWYFGAGSFVKSNPDLRRFVTAYINETDPTVAMATLFSATERLLRASLKAEAVQGKILTATLPNLLKFCAAPEQRFFNLIGTCCDVRAIFRLNAIRIGVEHGDHQRDVRELRQAKWNPRHPDSEYLKIIVNRLLLPHQMICALFDEVDPETGLFAKTWQPRGYAQCDFPRLHDENGRIPDEDPELSVPVE